MQPFFEAMHRAIRPGGMVCTQVHSFHHQTHFVTIVMRQSINIGYTLKPCTTPRQVAFQPLDHTLSSLSNLVLDDMWSGSCRIHCNRQRVVQAESLWLHLGIIKELAAMCHSVFEGGDVRYGYTTVPTYPRCLSHYFSLVLCASMM